MNDESRLIGSILSDDAKKKLQVPFGLERSSSAPPVISDFKGFGEDSYADPEYYAYYQENRALNPRLDHPLRNNWENSLFQDNSHAPPGTPQDNVMRPAPKISHTSAGEDIRSPSAQLSHDDIWGNDSLPSSNSSNSQQKKSFPSIVDKIQSDSFPRTPSPVYRGTTPSIEESSDEFGQHPQQSSMQQQQMRTQSKGFGYEDELVSRTQSLSLQHPNSGSNGGPNPHHRGHQQEYPPNAYNHQYPPNAYPQSPYPNRPFVGPHQMYSQHPNSAPHYNDGYSAPPPHHQPYSQGHPSRPFPYAPYGHPSDQQHGMPPFYMNQSGSNYDKAPYPPGPGYNTSPYHDGPHSYHSPPGWDRHRGDMPRAPSHHGSSGGAPHHHHAPPHHSRSGGGQHHHGRPSRRNRSRHFHKNKNHHHDPNRSKMMEDFKKGSKKIDLKDITNHVVEFSRDQHGSRFIQQKLESASLQEKDAIFKEIQPEALSLMTDVFGNYVIQKFFEFGNVTQKKQLTNSMQGHVLTLTLQTYGCRVIQKALDVIDTDDQKIIGDELQGEVIKCVQDQNGNHVIQKCIEKMSPSRVQFIVNSFKDQIYLQSLHAYGCRVIQRMLEHCTDGQTKPLLDEILRCIPDLVTDQYGNYVVQHVLEHGKPEYKASIIKTLKSRIVEHSTDKYASNVVERSFQFGNEQERDMIVEEITSKAGSGSQEDSIFTLMKDQYANFVVQKIIKASNDNHRDRIISAIKPHLPTLQRMTYGKHILSCISHYSDVSVLHNEANQPEKKEF